MPQRQIMFEAETKNLCRIHGHYEVREQNIPPEVIRLYQRVREMDPAPRKIPYMRDYLLLISAFACELRHSERILDERLQLLERAPTTDEIMDAVREDAPAEYGKQPINDGDDPALDVLDRVVNPDSTNPLWAKLSYRQAARQEYEKLLRYSRLSQVPDAIKARCREALDEVRAAEGAASATA